MLQPPQDYISSLQNVFIDFVWQGRYWLKSDRLYLYKSYGGLGLVQNLSSMLLAILSKLNEHVVTFFYSKKVPPPCPVDGIPFEPLWYNSYVTQNSNIITDTVIQQFISLGITQVKHLCVIKSYETQLRSKWIFESLKREITITSLPQNWNDALHNSSR